MNGTINYNLTPVITEMINKMDESQRVRVLTWKLHEAGDIAEQEADEIFAIPYAPYDLYDLHGNRSQPDKSVVTALALWYDEVYSQLKNGKDGNFVSTLPLVPIEEPGINVIVDRCLNLLPLHKKANYAELPAVILPVDRLSDSFEVVKGITLFPINRQTNIITLASARAALFQKINIKADLNEYAGIDTESSTAKRWWEHYFKEKSGQVSSKIFLSSYNDLWLHAIMKIAEQMRIKPLFIYTCDGGAKIYVNDDDYQKLKPYFDLDILLDMNKYKISAHMYDKSIIDEAVKELKELSQIKLDIIKEVEDDKWSEIIF